MLKNLDLDMYLLVCFNKNQTGMLLREDMKKNIIHNSHKSLYNALKIIISLFYSSIIFGNDTK
jgi:hypothetical protein